MKTILSLFDFSGNWSRPFKENGYNVIQIDLKSGCDIIIWDYKKIDMGEVYAILAAPPCTDFSVSGAQYWKKKDADGTTEKSIALVKKTLEIINYFNPYIYAIENPIGRMHKLIPELGKPWYFQPWEFGDPYTKKTCLWGKFHIPEKHPVKPVRACKQGSWIQRLGGKSERTKQLRSTTPIGFAYAFYEANKSQD